jgi:hypothetical protein
MKHIKRLNPSYSLNDLQQTSLILNGELEKPLSERETRLISRSVKKKDYKSSCYPFRPYCNPEIKCPLDINPNLTSEGFIKMLYPAFEVYPWEILDLAAVDSDKAKTVRELRAEKEMNPMIDVILKGKGLKIGDEAKDG